MNKKTYYITTPIYYPSSNPHVGHAYTTVAADCEARLRRMQGYDVMFLTGTDEHGQKIERSAAGAGMEPKIFVDGIVDKIKRLWSVMNISYDRFIRTTDEYHKRAVQEIFTKLYEKGDISKSEYEGLYCAPCESFWTETQGAGGVCPDCGRPVEKAKEESYFFRLSKYAGPLMEYYKENPEFLQPQSRVNEMVEGFLKPGLEDLAVSRTSFKWGIPVPFDEKHVIYVWVDALSNYITALGYPFGAADKGLGYPGAPDDYEKYWPADVHLMAKEIVRFHSIIWPAILMALDLPLPKKVFGHGWLLMDGGKMSKSKGNVVDPFVLCERYGADALRYYLLREIPFGLDGSFTNEALIARINSDLANDLGNLVSRSTAMADRYFGGKLPKESEGAQIDLELRDFAMETAKEYTRLLENLLFPNALSELWKLISRANKYIDETTPWILSKDEAKKPRLAAVLKNLIETIRVTAILLAPAMPETSEKILGQIGVSEERRRLESAAEFCVEREFSTKTAPPLFPRIDQEVEFACLESLSAGMSESGAKIKTAEEKPERDKKSAKPAASEDGDAGVITIKDCEKLDLRVAKVTFCEKVPKADRLLRFELDLGGSPRQIVSSIAEYYKPEELIGKNIIIFANLKPAKFRGIESHGMLLAADTPEGGVAVLFAPDTLPPGTRVH